jgi:transcription initiation factor TFIIA small subunit
MTADYRLGNALFEALDELIQSGHINPQLALKVLNQVSPSLNEVKLVPTQENLKDGSRPNCVLFIGVK